jgi:hypothetical protein
VPLPSPIELRKVFKVDTLSPDFGSCRSKKSYKMGWRLQNIHKGELMGCGSGCVVKELMMQSRLDGGFWISSIYARISEFVPTFVSESRPHSTSSGQAMGHP